MPTYKLYPFPREEDIPADEPVGGELPRFEADSDGVAIEEARNIAADLSNANPHNRVCCIAVVEVFGDHTQRDVYTEPCPGHDANVKDYLAVDSHGKRWEV